MESGWLTGVALSTAAAAADPGKLVLIDVFQYVVLAGLVALPAYWLIRRSSPLRRWNSHGSVYTEPLGVPDLCVAALFVGYFYTQAAGMAIQPPPDALPSAGTIGLILTVQAFLAGLLLFYLGFLRGVNLAEFFGVRRLSFPATLRCALLAAIGSAAAVTPAAFISYYLLQRAGISQEAQLPVRLIAEGDGPIVIILLVFMAVVAAPLWEEVIFRGFLYPVVKRFSDRFFAVLFSSAVFGLVHDNLGAFLPLTVFGIILALVYEWKGSIWLPVVLHALFNAVNVILILMSI